MRILVTAASFSSEISGIQRHALNMVRCLLRRTEISAVDLVLAPWQLKMAEAVASLSNGRLTIHIAQMQESPLSRNRWYYRDLPALAAQLQPDVAHLSYPVPVNAASFHCPIALTLHDLYPYEIPSNFRFPHVIFNRLALSQCLRNVSAIACVSDATMLRLRHYAPQSVHRKASRIYNCVEPETCYASLSPIPAWNGEPFLLTIAQHRRNKNIVLLVRAFHDLLSSSAIPSNMRLIVVGVDGPETRRIHRMVSQLGLRHHVHFLQGLSQPALNWCYANGEALIAPSKTEGFGLPVAEALLAGCRILCSDIAAFREVGATHCRFFPLGRCEQAALAEAIETTLKEPVPTPVFLPHLSVDVLAEQYVALYEQMIHRSPTSPKNSVPSHSLHQLEQSSSLTRIDDLAWKSREANRGSH